LPVPIEAAAEQNSITTTTTMADEESTYLLTAAAHNVNAVERGLNIARQSMSSAGGP